MKAVPGLFFRATLVAILGDNLTWWWVCVPSGRFRVLTGACYTEASRVASCEGSTHGRLALSPLRATATIHHS